MFLVQPGFVTYEEKDREAYLSQMGNFSPAERSVFHKLCKVWEPLIDYNHIFSVINRDTLNANSELMRLMTKLAKLSMGIITTKIQEGQRVPQGIVLCEPATQVFYAYMLDEGLLDVYQNLLTPISSRSQLKEKNVLIPSQYINKKTYAEIAEAYISKKTGSREIYGLDLGVNDTIYLAANSITRVLTIHISKMRSYFQSPNFLSLGASAMEMRLVELKAKLSTKEPGFWKLLATTLINKKENLKAQRKVKLPSDLFSVCFFLRQFLDTQITAAGAKKKRDEELKSDMLMLLETIKNGEHLMASHDIFEKQLEVLEKKYGDNSGSIREDFDTSYLHPPKNKNLPVILAVENNYIHQDNIKPLFLHHVEKTSRELYKHYLPLMSRYVGNEKSRMANIFISVSTFEADIGEQIQEQDKLLSVLLSMPGTVAEAFIHFDRRSTQIDDVKAMKAALVGFFYPEKVKFKELQIIFNLDLKALYQRAFLNLGIFRQILLRIAGKHESFIKKFSELNQSIYRKMASESALPGNYDQEQTAKKQPRKNNRRRQERSAAGAGERITRNSNGQARKQAEIQKESHLYSQKERDTAWSEFSKNFKK